jgi:hypothetical protein
VYAALRVDVREVAVEHFAGDLSRGHRRHRELLVAESGLRLVAEPAQVRDEVGEIAVVHAIARHHRRERLVSRVASFAQRAREQRVVVARTAAARRDEIVRQRRGADIRRHDGALGHALSFDAVATAARQRARRDLRRAVLPHQRRDRAAGEALAVAIEMAAALLTLAE